MSTLKCNKCRNSWEATERPECPRCREQFWSSLPSMITDKHDPGKLPSADTAFRSTLPSDFLQQSDACYQHVAYSGTALYHTFKKEICYVASVPVHLSAGSAVPSGSAMPTRPMDSYLIAKATSQDAHIFADDDSRIQKMIADGTLQWLPTCSFPECENLSVPGFQVCALHSSPPLAEA